MFEIIPNWHPIFVHFTVALLSLAVGLYAITPFIKSSLGEQWKIVARWTLWFGAAFSIITGLTGLYAYNTVAHDTPSHLAMSEHRNWAIATIFSFLALTTWSIVRFRKNKTLGASFAIAMLVAGGVLASTAWHGGEAVYRYGLGVMSLPKAEGDGHNHSHGDDHAQVSNTGNSDDHHASIKGDHPNDLSDKTMDFGGMEEVMNDSSHGHDDGHDHAH